MSIYKKGNIYWMSKQYQGRRIERSLDTSKKREAEERHALIVSQIIDGSYFNKVTGKKPLTEMIDRYTLEYTEYKTYYAKARDKSIVKKLYEFFGKTATLQDVENTVGGYGQHRRTQGVAPATIVKELGLLRRMFNVGRKQWKWKVSNPVSDIELPRVKNERVRYLSPDERKRLFKALAGTEDKWLPGLVTTALGTGLREGNLCGLTWSEIHLPERMITIDAERMKNGEYLGIPIPEDVCQFLQSEQKVRCLTGHVFHDNGVPLYPVKVQRAFRKVLKAAEITNFRFHDLRHCYCSSLRQKGIDLHTISVLAGHSDTRMTKRYSHLCVDNLRGAVEMLETTTVLLQQENEPDAVAM